MCSTGSVCDDFSAIAQRLERMGFPITWWEMPRRRAPEAHEAACPLPGGLTAPQCQVDCVRAELERIAELLGRLAGQALTTELLAEGIRQANQVRRRLGELRQTVYSAVGAPLPALEMLVAEMLAIHFCSDRAQALEVLTDLLDVAAARLKAGQFVVGEAATRIFWVNPVADLRAMNLLEDWGGRICGSDYMFTHALDPIPEDLPPMEALARTALADPMVGSTQDRAGRIMADCRACRAEAVVISQDSGRQPFCLGGGELAVNHKPGTEPAHHRIGNPLGLRRDAAHPRRPHPGPH